MRAYVKESVRFVALVFCFRMCFSLGFGSFFLLVFSDVENCVCPCRVYDELYVFDLVLWKCKAILLVCTVYRQSIYVIDDIAINHSLSTPSGALCTTHMCILLAHTLGIVCETRNICYSPPSMLTFDTGSARHASFYALRQRSETKAPRTLSAA